MSPTPGRSTLITSAPMKASSCVQVGPDCTCVKSSTRTPSSALPASPHGLVEGLGQLARVCAAGLFALSLTTFFTAGVDLAFAMAVAFLAVLFAIFISSRLFLAQHALRVEIANSAALAACRRVDHRVDQGGLAGG